MPHKNKPKPDDRSDNVEKLQQMIQDTEENMEASYGTMSNSAGEEKQQIREKNKRREQSIDSMRKEIEDEYNHNKYN